MDKKLREILMKSAEYVERTQPLIDKQNEENMAFVERATKAAGVLASRGVLDKRSVDGFVDKIASDPKSVWDVVEKLASLVGVDTLGEVGREKVASAGVQDPWEARFFGNNSDAHLSGMVD